MPSSSPPPAPESSGAAMPALQYAVPDPPASHVLQLAADGHVVALRVLLGRSPSLARVANDIARTPLHVAAAEGHAHIVRLLLQTGADGGARDAYGRTPADEAIRAGHVLVLRVLAFFDAPCAPLASRLYADTAPCRALFDAAAAGDVRAATVAVLVFGAHVNVTNVDGRTPLHLAVAAGHVAVASYLIASGADATIKDRRGVTPTAAANIATDPAIRALFEGVRASGAAKITTMQAAAAAAADPPRRRGASLPRITRVAAQKAATAAQDSQPRFEIHSVPVKAVENSRKRHSAPHIVKVQQDIPGYTAQPSPRHDPLRQQEQARLLQSALSAAEQHRRASLAESEAMRSLEQDAERVHAVELVNPDSMKSMGIDADAPLQRRDANARVSVGQDVQVHHPQQQMMRKQIQRVVPMHGHPQQVTQEQVDQLKKMRSHAETLQGQNTDGMDVRRPTRQVGDEMHTQRNAVHLSPSQPNGHIAIPQEITASHAQEHLEHRIHQVSRMEQQHLEHTRLHEAQLHAKQYLQQHHPKQHSFEHEQSHQQQLQHPRTPMAQSVHTLTAHPVARPVGHTRPSSAPASSPPLAPSTLMTGTTIN